MTELENVKNEYIKMFGGYPAFLLMGAEDSEIIEKLSKCVRSGEELGAEEDTDY